MNEKIKPFSQAGKKTPFFISLAGITYPDSSYSITRKISNVNVIEYVLDGEGCVFVDGIEHTVKKDTIYILYKGQPHKYYSVSKNPFTKIFLNITGDFFDSIIDAYSLSNRHFFENKELKPKFQKILEIIDADITDSEKQAALQGIFLEIIAILSLDVENVKYSHEINLLKDYIDEHISSIVSAEELSRVIYRSKSYCLKLFKKEFGITPYEYQLENKIKTAKNLLANTSLPVGEIAEKLGYSDMHYFSNVFYKKSGIRPLAYRKSKK